MQTQSIISKVKRAWIIGPTKICFILYHRWKKKRFIRRTGNNKNSTKKSHHSIHESQLLIACRAMLNDQEFMNTIWPANSYQTQCYKNADLASQATINILGYGQCNFASHAQIQWHNDITTNVPSPASWKNAFFADIAIPENSNDAWQPDIKVPWELSRMHQLVDLGLGYQQATLDGNSEKQSVYCNAFVQQVDSWMDHNPFPHGVNWVNPMEVAIRAINILWATAFFKDEQHINTAWWNTLSSSLAQHALFIENTLEVSDKPNNHYLTDLVGLFYLHCFFSDKGKTTKTLSIITKAFAQQILLDGTSYEGSTAYHRLDTELLCHVLFLCKHMNIPVPQKLTAMYTKMHEFVDDCTDDYGNFVTIGDDDGGKIVWGYEVENELCNQSTRRMFCREPGHAPLPNPRIKTYPNFGLTIIKHNGWHITFRHASYKHNQPTGHFHHDALSITVFLHGNQLICDPGSYVYTSNAQWRNTFRDADYHSTVFVEQPLQSKSLFQLDRTAHNHQAIAEHNNGKISITDWAEITQGILVHRALIFDREEQTLMITDWTTKVEKSQANMSLTKTLHWGPDIKLEKNDANTWLVKKGKKIVATLFSDMNAQLKKSYYAPTYGKKIETQTWQATTCAYTKNFVILRANKKN